MKVHDDGSGAAIYLAGGFLDAGGLPSHHFAQFCRPGVFADGFESGLPDAWSQVFP